MRTQAYGWGVFGVTMLFVVGAMNIVQGLVALFVADFYAATGGGQTLLAGVSLWAWIIGIWGIVLVLAGFALLSHQTWARTVAVVLTAANIVAQMGFLTALPLWSVMIMAMNVVVVFAMTAGWPSAARGSEREREGEAAAYYAGQADARGAPAPAGETEEDTRGESTAQDEQQQPPRTGYGKHAQRT